jgi:tRNA-2-methylthio-N6-dimethylallyladenosine synthase
VLKAMQRSYRRERYLGWLERIRAAIPDIAVSTDIIVGFPGETEEDFEDTLDVVRRARFDQAYTFQYSPRPGTRAAEMDGQLDKPEVQERFDRLVALQEAIALERMGEQVGSSAEVLIEGLGRKGGARGRTRGNRVVHVGGEHAPGTFLDVRIVGAHPHHLDGELAGGPGGSRSERERASGSPPEQGGPGGSRSERERASGSPPEQGGPGGSRSERERASGSPPEQREPAAVG